MFSYPLDLLRVRLAFEVRNSEQPSVQLLETISTIYNEPNDYVKSNRLRSFAGISNFYRGFMPTMYGMIPYAGVSFLTYETLKSYAQTHHSQYTLDDKGSATTPKLRAWVSLAIGGVSGVLAQTSSYPFEVIRRHMQVSARSTSGKHHDTTWNTMRAIYKRKGFGGFWVGLGIGYFKIVPLFAVSFYTYEWLKFHMQIE